MVKTYYAFQKEEGYMPSGYNGKFFAGNPGKSWSMKMLQDKEEEDMELFRAMFEKHGVIGAKRLA